MVPVEEGCLRLDHNEEAQEHGRDTKDSLDGHGEVPHDRDADHGHVGAQDDDSQVDEAVDLVHHRADGGELPLVLPSVEQASDDGADQENAGKEYEEYPSRDEDVEGGQPFEQFVFEKCHGCCGLSGRTNETRYSIVNETFAWPPPPFGTTTIQIQFLL